MYTNTNSLQLICENSCLNSANFTCRVIFRVILENFIRAQKDFTQESLVTFVTNSISVYFLFGLLSFCLSVFLSFCPLVHFASFGGVGELYVRDGMGLLIIGHRSFKSTFRAK